ncbi:MAG: flagellar hook-associated protein FlgK [Acidobacteriota bacterium]
MPSIFTTLLTSANALGVYEKVFATISNNVNNASTPGYARQRLSPTPLPFDPFTGMSGGITAGALESTRNEYAEQAVWRNQFAFGNSDQLASELTNVEPLFDVTGDTGIPLALNQLFAAFSSWSIAPNDMVARGTVIDRSVNLAQQFNSLSTGLMNAATAVNNRARGAVDTINNLAGQIAAVNAELRSSFENRANAGIDARLHNALESLAEYADYSALVQADGTVTVLLGGQTVLVSGDQANYIDESTTTGSLVVYDSTGKDITGQITGGRLKALIDTKNTLLVEFMDDANRLAAGFADGINAMLAAGVDANGNPGAPLFSYDTAANAAFTLKVTPITPAELAAAHASSPGGNGNALDLTALASQPQIDGMSFMQFYSSLAGRVGQALQGAKADRQTEQDLLVQARSMRSDYSSVSLDEQAALLIEYQRAYEAAARVVTVLNDLTQTTIDMMFR